MQTRTDLINYLIKKNSFHSYLEIGLNNPYNNFVYIDCKNKTSVDPYLEDPYDLNTNKNIKDWLKFCTHRMTSDKFFKKNKKTFDIIFIDGLHEESQVDNDIYNSLKCLQNGGVIVVHDCLPPTEAHQSSPRIQGTWNGDVWKSLVKMSLIKHPNLKVSVINLDWGCGIIQKFGTVEYNKPNLLNMPWSFFDKYKFDLVNIINPDESLLRL